MTKRTSPHNWRAYLLICVFVRPIAADTIHGAGATFPAPLYIAWAREYERMTGAHITYDALGSGVGLERIRNHQVDFGASDVPMTQQELANYGLIQFPAVIGGVVPVINISGIAPGQLKLNGAVLADIYLGRIRRWNDSAIAALNPDILLPSARITVVHRSEASGTTLLFTDYLSHSNPEWRRNVGISLTPRWPTGVGGVGNAGVASFVQRTRFAIGYVEYIFSRDHHLSDVALMNRSGALVHASRDAFRAAVEATNWGAIDTIEQLPTDPPGERSWPITGASFLLMPRQSNSRDSMHATLSFFDWALHQGTQVSDSLAYASIPASILDQLPALWGSISDSAGKAVWP